jgi:hypothetical protein
MKNMSKVKILVAMMLLASVVNAEESELSYGLGIGALYNGVGINIASPTKEDLKYVSLGCMDFSYSSYVGFNTNCGLGIGYINTSIIGDSNKHGLGLHLAVHEDDGGDSSTQVSLGVGYTYFLNQSKIGWNFGLTPIYIFGDSENDNKVALLFDLGYEF